MKGTFYGVGVGPGDPRLMTILAVETIRSCPVVAVPLHGYERGVAYPIARGMIDDLDAKECVGFRVPMSKDRNILTEAYQRAAADIIEKLREGKDVACLTLGDPTIYSSYIYLHRIVQASGFHTEIISGVPSFCAVSAKLGDSLVDRDEQLHVIPSSYGLHRSSPQTLAVDAEKETDPEIFGGAMPEKPENESSAALAAALQLPGTKVLMKAGTQIGAVKALLRQQNCSCRMVENCGMPDEKVYACLEDIPEKAGYYSVIVVKEDSTYPKKISDSVKSML